MRYARRFARATYGAAPPQRAHAYRTAARSMAALRDWCVPADLAPPSYAAGSLCDRHSHGRAATASRRPYEAISAERVAVAAALGASVPTLADWFDRVYGVRGATLVETCQRLTFNSDGPYQATGTPKSLDHKFITEDVPTGLIPMSALGAAAGVGTPAIDAVIEIVRSMTGRNFAADGRTLERLGLDGMDALQIRRVMEEGFPVSL